MIATLTNLVWFQNMFHVCVSFCCSIISESQTKNIMNKKSHAQIYDMIRFNKYNINIYIYTLIPELNEQLAAVIWAIMPVTCLSTLERWCLGYVALPATSTTKHSCKSDIATSCYHFCKNHDVDGM